MSAPRVLLLLCLVAATAPGCATLQRIAKAGPAEPAGFLADPEGLSEMRQRYPFHRVWMKPGSSFEGYERVAVARVDVSHLRMLGLWEQASLRRNLHADAEQLAREFREILLETFRGDLAMRLEVVEEPGPRTIVLEIGLVEVVPTKAWLAAVGLASWALPLAVGIPIGTGASLLQPGSVAIEGTLRDAETGELIAAFADRERSKARVVDLQALTWYGHAREIFMDWASQLLQLLTTPNDRMVRDSAIFDPLPF